MNKCKIIDADQMAVNYDTQAKLDKLRSNKVLHDLIHSEATSNLDAKVPMKISKSALTKLARGPKGRPRKQAKHVDLDKFTVPDDGYVYKDYTKCLETVIPNAINKVSFNTERFASKMQKSHDLKHSISKLFDIEITNDYVGCVATLGALIAEELVETKLGFNNQKEQEKLKAYDKEVKNEVKQKDNMIVINVSDTLGNPSNDKKDVDI